MLKVCTKQYIIITIELVARKPVNVTAKLIGHSNVLVTWSPLINNDPLIAGYEVFYSVSDCNYKTFSGRVTNLTFLTISAFCSAQNYSFFVVSYSNEEHTFSSEWSNVFILIAGKYIY